MTHRSTVRVADVLAGVPVLKCEVLLEVSMKITVSWDVTTCSLVQIYPTFLRSVRLNLKEDNTFLQKSVKLPD
jgi:hypothetical protein